MLKNLRWGILSGMAFATLFSAWIILLAIVRRSWEFDSYHVSAWQIILSYFAGGIGGGAVVGLARPITRYRLGAAVVGLVAAIPVAFAVEFAMQGMPGSWPDDAWIGFYFIAGFLGPVAGLIRWKQTYGRG
jgi:hypothetical protein